MIPFLIALVGAIAMATYDAHPVEAGKSQTLLAKAQYPKVYVHFVGGLALAALLAPFITPDIVLLIAVTALGAIYEAMQWFNIRGTKRGGVFTIAEALAVALGGLVFLAVNRAGG